MKALSIRQPWASLIASGRKTIELRSWRTHYRGPLLICSGSRPSSAWRPEDAAVIGPLGVSVCIVDVIDCRLATPDDAHAACTDPSDGLFAWVLANARATEHRPVKGKLSFFQVEGFEP